MRVHIPFAPTPQFHLVRILISCRAMEADLSIPQRPTSPWANSKRQAMNFRKLAAIPALMIAMDASVSAVASEQNYWPIVVRRQNSDAGGTGGKESVEALAAIGFHESGGAAPRSVSGARPLYLVRRDAAGTISEAHFLYPLLSYRASADGHRWSFLNLINRSVAGSSSEMASFDQALDVWPIYFSRQYASTGDSYRAIFPLAGSIPHRFGQDRVTWALFPLYGRFEKRGTTTLTVPWPFVKVLSGNGHRGFELWPLFGSRTKPGLYREGFALWPLLYRNETWADGRISSRQIGMLPFYARDEAVGYKSETFLWPFFGYVDRTIPYVYHARNYFWPLFVQGRGDDRIVNRWAPFYTHSRIKGTDKTWVLWPLWRKSSWTEGALRHERSQLLYFLYNANIQRSAARPEAEPASKIHVWPLWSSWNNGAGNRQLQVLSPFEVFFPRNEQVRDGWSPLFALYRFDRDAAGDTRHVALWNAVSYSRNRSTRTTSFHLGPLLSVETSLGRGRVRVIGGLFDWQRKSAGAEWGLRIGNFLTDSVVSPRQDLHP